MGFPEGLLVGDEQVAEHLHPHWLTLLPAALTFLATCALTGGFLAIVPSGSAHRPFVVVIVVLALVVVVWRCIVPLLRWRTTHYVLTTNRVIIRVGVLRQTGRDIALNRINDVIFQRSLGERMVGAGTLIIESAGELGRQRLVDLPRAHQVQQLLNRLIADDQRR